MRFEEMVERDVVASAHDAERPRHRLDVAEHLGRGHVPGVLAERGRGLGAQQAPASDLQALDLR